MNQTQERAPQSIIRPYAAGARRGLTREAAARLASIGLVLFIALFFVGRATPTPVDLRNAAINMAVAGYGFDLLGWEVRALSEKLGAAINRPSLALSAKGETPTPIELETQTVRAYMDRAQRMGALEGEINRILAENPGEIQGEAAARVQALQAQIDALRSQQAATRVTVERIIERQVSRELVDAGVDIAGHAFPPVQFTFSEPPKKLVVSPRDRIAIIYYRMLKPTIDLPKIEEAENQIDSERNLSAYITRIGGLGAYPSMVVDRASLPWVLSTVAHEWTHNYLTLFPLGIRYNASPRLTTMNETVADIVGDEVGEQVLRRYYPDLVPPKEAENPVQEPLNDEEEPVFDFATEMHKTRLRVDELLAAGKVEEAEAYMEARRQEFVAHGYPLRVLNQAYFAFHGSYGTSPASSDPLGPKLERLRALSPSVGAFLKTVRGFTSPEDVDAALEALEAAGTP